MYKTSHSQVKIVMILDWADTAPGTSQTTKIWAVRFEHNNLCIFQCHDGGDTKPNLRISQASVVLVSLCWSQIQINGRLASGRASGVKTEPNQICGSIRYGNPTGNNRADESTFLYFTL